MTATKLESVFSSLALLGFVAIMVSIMAGFSASPPLLHLLMKCAIALFVIELIVVFGMRWSRSHAKHLLEDLDYKMCPNCRYVLTGLGNEGRCPECAERFEAEWLKHIWTLRYSEKSEPWHNADA